MTPGPAGAAPSTPAGAPTGADVTVRGLAKAYGSVRAVDDVTLEIAAGEFVALLGPSGSGKTTILMSIAGFETPDAGRIAIGGRDVTDLPPARREIGMVFQRYALFPHMTVAENIAFPLRMRGVRGAAARERVEDALAMVRLAGYGARRISQLSGGQQQRVALARALVYRPPVLLMDEPLGALDKNLREEMQLEIKRLQQRLGTTVIYVTHDQAEALTMADRIAVLNDGRLQQYDTPREVYRHPANLFVAGFVGEANIVPGTLSHAAGSWALRVPGGPKLALDGIAPQPGWRQGGEARLVARPEQLRLAQGGPGVAARVEEVIYGGGSVACVVRLGPDCVMTARLPEEDGAALRPGMEVRVPWPPGRAAVFPA